MWKRRRSASMAIVLLLILAGLAVACAPQATPTDQVRVGSSASPSATPSSSAEPGQKLPPVTRIRIGHPVDANAGQAINDIGLSKYPDIYAGGRIQADGSITIYLGPGNDTVFLNALHALLASPGIEALGPTPKTTIVRVPHSEDDFTAARIAFQKVLPQLKSEGYLQGGGHPTRRWARTM